MKRVLSLVFQSVMKFVRDERSSLHTLVIPKNFRELTDEELKKIRA